MNNLSKLSKISGVAYILIGVFMLLGWFFVDPVSDFFNNLFWAAACSFLIIGVINVAVEKGIVISSYISRILLGALFIVSGLIKANDTLGFSFKLEEYFAEAALGWTIFEPYSMPLSLFIAGIEVVLGLAVLFGGLIRLSSWALLGMILFFAWLTYFTASCNDAQLMAMSTGEEFHKACVTDCGCFGDALKGSIGRSLTPWESFFKDITLLAYSLIVFIMQKHIKFNTKKEDAIILPVALLFNISVGGWLFGWWFPLIFTVIIIGLYLLIKKKFESKAQMMTAILALAFSFGFAFYTYTYLPIKDYRGYAKGNNLIEKKNDGIPQVNNNLFSYKHKVTGEVLEIPQEDYMKRWEEIERDYDFIESVDRVVLQGKAASIQNFGPYKYYKHLSESEKSEDSIVAQIEKKYSEYFEKYIVLKDKKYGYVDSVEVVAYDPVYYPDSIYENLGEVEKRVNTENWEIDFTNYLLSLDRVLILVSYDYDKSNKEAWNDIQPLVEAAANENIPVYCLASVSNEEAEGIKKEFNLNATFLLADATELKIIVRSNPGIVYLENAFVKGKWDYNRIPTLDKLK